MNYKSISKLFMLGFILAFMFSSCTKEGPMGPAGANGIDGTNGTDGTDGVDGNVSCLVCHSAEVMDEITLAFATTKHVTGSSWARGTSSSCGRCHSSDGFVEYTRSGEAIGAAISTSMSCETCHDNHSSLEEGITAPLRDVGDEVEFIANPGTSRDFEAGNLCATCHQARRPHTDYYASEAKTATRTFTGDDIAVYQAHGAVGPNGSKTLNATKDTLTVVFDIPTTHVYTSSTHAGPHHGPQANIIAANIGTAQGVPFEAPHHNCVNCHLHGDAGGHGHTFAPDYPTMCNDCHGDLVDVEGDQAAIAARMAVVEAALEDIGAIHVAADGVHPMYASLPKAQWDAFWNFMCLWEDSSHGVHNFVYADQLLDQAENALGL
ncbi:cytochrome c3 family protein [uncultured Draconibacterium sp.]|uniref:cytochrome c3 family protein n=1 Tax=uncultured Draconibacterium sp. TaxID=1573823 RepID=UPI002AA93126|nr:cytochrome c3 family protein [uncultured Draconibacterium sp.]